ncbi:hypothetical protein BM51_1693 [Streptococcus pneumoniae]|nr:hypothetical protein BM51_1693 [Streptococcus pneumoniae]
MCTILVSIYYTKNGLKGLSHEKGQQKKPTEQNQVTQA